MPRKRRVKASDAGPQDWQARHDVMSQHAVESPTTAIERFRSLYLDLGSDLTVDDADHSLVILGVVLSERMRETGAVAGDFWRACIETEFPLLLLDMINDPRFFDNDSVFCEIVIACLRFFVYNWNEVPPGTTEDGEVGIPLDDLGTYWDRFDSACDVLWAGREHLTDRILDAVEELVDNARVLFYGPGDVKYMSDYESDRLVQSSMVKLGLYAWAHNDKCILHRGLATFSEVCLLQDKERVEFNKLITHLLDTLGVARIIDAIHDALKGSRGMFGRSLEHCFVTLEAFLAYGDKSVLDAYYQKPMLLAICTALRRHADFGERVRRKQPLVDRELREDMDVWIHASTQLLRICGGFSQKSSSPPAQGDLLVFVLIQGMTVVTTIHDADPSPEKTQLLADAGKCARRFKECVGVLSESIQYTLANRNGCPPALVDELRALRINWFERLFRLHCYPRQIVNKSSLLRTLLEGWMQFGAALEFYDVSEREHIAAPRTHLCLWRECEFHQRPSPQPLLICKGCHEARYCSSSCQRRDWKEGGHRAECRRLQPRV